MHSLNICPLNFENPSVAFRDLGGGGETAPLQVEGSEHNLTGRGLNHRVQKGKACRKCPDSRYALTYIRTRDDLVSIGTSPAVLQLTRVVAPTQTPTSGVSTLQPSPATKGVEPVKPVPSFARPPELAPVS